MKKLFLFVVLLLIPIYLGISSINELVRKERLFFNYFSSAEFNIETLKAALLFCNIAHPEIVLRQSKIETSHFKSGVFKRSNNLFGMKYSTKRKNTAISFIYADKGKVATYSNWFNSVQDYALLVNDFHAAKNKSNYYKFLEEIGYCEKSGYYTELLKRMK